jgi:hypothetical protein
MTMHCSFCGRPDSEVAKLVAGPWRLFAGRVYICDRCATQTIRIMEGTTGEPPTGPRREPFVRRILRRLGRLQRRDTFRLNQYDRDVVPQRR